MHKHAHTHTHTHTHAHIRTPLLDCALSLQQVLQVQHKATGVIHAMKIMKKERILQKDHSEYVRSERDVLTSVVHPYIVNLRCSFQVSLTARIAGRGFAML
jgi:serine/threonine protein kinase